MNISKFVSFTAAGSILLITGYSLVRLYRSTRTTPSVVAPTTPLVLTEHHLLPVPEVVPLLDEVFQSIWDSRFEDGLAVQHDPQWEVSPLVNDDAQLCAPYAVYAQPVLADAQFAWCEGPAGQEILLIGGGGHNAVVSRGLDGVVQYHCLDLEGLNSQKYIHTLLDGLVDYYADLRKVA